MIVYQALSKEGLGDKANLCCCSHATCFITIERLHEVWLPWNKYMSISNTCQWEFATQNYITCRRSMGKGVSQGGVTPIDPVLPPATGVKILDRLF